MMRSMETDSRRPAARYLLAGLLSVVAALAVARPAAAQGFRHCGEINRNETWTSQDAHIVTCDVRVRNSTLTIAPNVQVLMGEGTSLIIEPGAKLEILGNPDTNEPVRILPNAREVTPGFWGQIRVEPGAEESVVQYAIIMGGGADEAPMIDIGAVTQLFLVDLRFSGGAPLAFDANVLGPSLEVAGQALSAGICNVVSLRPGEHAQNEVVVHADEAIDLRDSQFWHHFCMPYRVDDTLTIGGPDLPTLSLSPGVELRFAPGTGLVAGADPENPGHFEANGEDGAPVVLTGVEKTPGSWLGLEFTEHADPNTFNSLFYTRVEYGGSPERPMVLVRAPQLISEKPVFAYAPGYPVAIRPLAVTDFTGGLTGGEAFVDNVIQGILVLADEVDLDLPRSAEWKDPGVPLLIDGDLRVAAPDVARLYLDAGLHLIFVDGSGLTLGDPDDGDAGFYVRGRRNAPVKLESLSATPGSWRGVTITDQTLVVEIDHLDLGYGGAGGRPMLDWGDAEGFMAGSLLHHAAGVPLAIDLWRITAVASDDQLDPGQKNRYEDNGTGHIAVRVEGNYGPHSSERVLEWADPGLPLAFDEDLTVAADGGVLLRLNGGMDLRFEAGKGFQLSDANVRGALDLQASAEEPVRLGPVDAAAGWAGMRMVPGSSLDGRGLHIAGVTGESPVSLSVRRGAVELADLVLEGTAGTGVGLSLEGEGSRMHLAGARVTGFGTGVRSTGAASFEIERSVIAGNADWGVHSEGNPECQLATLVYWGSPTGPTDPSDALDDCMDLAYEGGGDRVSDGVVWWRYAIDEQGTPASGIGPGAITVFLPSVLRNQPAR